MRSQRAPVVDRLRPGLDPGAVTALLEPLGLGLPEEARRWWGWHDGATAAPQDPWAVIALGPVGRFEPLHIAVEHARMRRQIAFDVEPGRVELVWPPSLLPLLEGGNVALDCSGPPHAPTPVWRTDPRAFDRPEVGARSLGELVDWWLETLRTGGWRWSTVRGHWLVDDALLERHPERRGLV